ncbi:molecular chaperone TorD family protein [Desulfonatronospira sp.]|uniref:TorD/DmsD family molecular chaperone n=1 Tax=Desulfonatronospira sp. TaxID=1962951 RepID=UPI0025C54967|nr:molecular chaperone TorD family protein [Desulfonatronospira sp.]
MYPSTPHPPQEQTHASAAASKAHLQHETRGLIYSLISSAYRDVPDSELLSLFQTSQEKVLNFLQSSPVSEAKSVSNSMQQIILTLQEHERDFLPLRKQFTALFLHPEGVHAYESVYMGKKKRLMDKPWVEVKNFYLEYGLEKGSVEELTEDHIAVELGFMAHLAYMSADDELEEGELDLLAGQAKFLEQHVLQWVPRLCRDMTARPFTGFYGLVARMTQSWVVLDHRALQEAL